MKPEKVIPSFRYAKSCVGWCTFYLWYIWFSHSQSEVSWLSDHCLMENIWRNKRNTPMKRLKIIGRVFRRGLALIFFFFQVFRMMYKYSDIYKELWYLLQIFKGKKCFSDNIYFLMWRYLPAKLSVPNIWPSKVLYI